MQKRTKYGQTALDIAPKHRMEMEWNSSGELNARTHDPLDNKSQMDKSGIKDADSLEMEPDKKPE